MLLNQIPRKILVLLSAGMILAGAGLAAWSLSQLPLFNNRPVMVNDSPEATTQDTPAGSVGVSNDDASESATETAGEVLTDEVSPNEQPPAATPVLANPIVVQLDGVPPSLQRLADSIAISATTVYTTNASAGAPVVRLDLDSAGAQPVQEVVFVASTRFDTIFPATTWDDVQATWRGARVPAAAGDDTFEEDAVAPDAGKAANEEQDAIEAELAAAAEKAAEAGMNVSLDDLAAAGLTRATVGVDLAAQFRLNDAVQFGVVTVLSDTIPALTQILGPAGPNVQGYGGLDSLVDATWAVTNSLTLLPFDELQPRLAALAIDGQNPVENANRFDIEQYPFVATIYAHVGAANANQQALADDFLAQIPPTNRDPDRLTVLAMTGVTAMVRLSAPQIDRYGPDWLAEVVGPELAAADITHVSNEVPFVPGCETNIAAFNFNFCSPPDYMRALELVGVDIIGLTGNHQNDFGPEAAHASLDIYADAGLPVYGGGRNKEAAFAPLYIEHNGNRFAFLGANSYGPELAWATDDEPGSAEFNLAIMSATIRSIKERDLADLVLPELQYQESSGVTPLYQQRRDFNDLLLAGADIVTGVQSHVPQAVEFTDGKLILYGLGNLFFDQMLSRVTREGLIVKHTFYDGQHISSQFLTTLLYDYAQPRWMNDVEREQLLNRVFDASYWE